MSSSYTIDQALDILLAAVLVELRRDGLDEDICAHAIYPGDSIVLDYAECGGMVWVRLVDAFETVGFPNRDVTVNSCEALLAATVEVGVMHPSPIPEEILNTVDLPDDAEHTAAARRQIKEMRAMRRAMQETRRVIGKDLLLVGAYTPVGPVGGTVGGTWSVTLGEE